MVVEAPAWRGARRAHTRRYATDEQRSQTGWIGGQSDRAILRRAPRVAFSLMVAHLAQVDAEHGDNAIGEKSEQEPHAHHRHHHHRAIAPVADIVDVSDP